MKKIWQLIYNYVLLPVLVLLTLLALPFSTKIRKSFFQRFNSIKNLKDEISDKPPRNKIVLLHAASMGEFEHVKYLLQLLKEKYNTTNIVTVFSPSAFDNISPSKDVDHIVYIPPDFKRNWNRLYKQLEPDVIIISKHDIWPMQIWSAKKHNIPLFLINASLGARSTRVSWYSRIIFKHVYRDISKIYTISEEDKSRFDKHFPGCNTVVMGDSKFDQVIQRKKKALQKSAINQSWWENNWIFLAGSIWPEDEEHLIPALKTLLTQYNNTRLILVPHQPGEKHISRLVNEFNEWDTILYSDLVNLGDQRVLIVNNVGHLAEMYRYGKVAYVGGSFKQGIHNVMEPAIYSIPVIYGPVHTNSYEAVQLAAAGGGFPVSTEQELQDIILDFYKNDDKRVSAGKKAMNHSIQNTGTTERLVNEWQGLLKS